MESTGTLARDTAENFLVNGRRMVNRYLLRVFACAFLVFAAGSAQAQDASCPVNLGTANVIDHDFSVSFCELCETGTVRIEVENLATICNVR